MGNFRHRPAKFRMTSTPNAPMNTGLLVTARRAYPWPILGILLSLIPASVAFTQPAAGQQVDETQSGAPSNAASSPWLLAPLVSSSPKLGTSFGALGAYLKVFDPASRVSLF